MPITTAQALLAIDFLDLIPSCLIRDPIVGSHIFHILRLVMDGLQFRKPAVPTSRFRGVYAFRSPLRLRYKWQCFMAIDETRREHLGTFETEILAAQAFDTRARTLGRSSECNFDEETQPRIPNEDLSYDKTQGQPADKSIPPPAWFTTSSVCRGGYWSSAQIKDGRSQVCV